MLYSSTVNTRYFLLSCFKKESCQVSELTTFIEQEYFIELSIYECTNWLII